MYTGVRTGITLPTHPVTSYVCIPNHLMESYLSISYLFLKLFYK